MTDPADLVPVIRFCCHCHCGCVELFLDAHDEFHEVEGAGPPCGCEQLADHGRPEGFGAAEPFKLMRDL